MARIGKVGAVGAVGPGRILAAVLGGLGLLTVLFLAIGGLLTETPLGPGFGVTQLLVGVVPLYLAAVFLVVRCPGNAVSTYYLVAAVLLVLLVVLEPVVTIVCAGDDPGGCFWAANLAYQWAAVGTVVASMGTAVLFPDGTAERPWHRRLLRWTWVLLAVPPLLLVCSPGPVVHPYLVGPAVPQVNPFAVAWLAQLGPPLAQVFRYHYLVVVLGGLIVFARYRRADTDQRRRMRWPIVTFLVFVALLAVYVVAVLLDARAVQTALGWLFGPIVLVSAVSLVHGVLRHGLLGVDVMVHRSIVYGALVWGSPRCTRSRRRCRGWRWGGPCPSSWLWC